MPLADYDFDRQGFPFASYQQLRESTFSRLALVPLLKGIVRHPVVPACISTSAADLAT